MHVIAKKRLREFWTLHRDAEQPLKTWHDIAKHAAWTKPTDLRKDFAAVSIVANNRAVFDIGGNKYRLVVRFDYRVGIAFIRFIGTHADYDDIDATTI